MPARFMPSPGVYAGGWFDQAHGIVTVSLGQTVQIGFQDDWTVDANSADVRFNDFGNPDGVAKLTPLPMSAGGLRQFRIEPRRVGNVILEGRTAPSMGRDWFQMPVQAFIQVHVIAAAAGREDQLLHAYHEGAIYFAPGFEDKRNLFLMAAEGRPFEGAVVQHSPELIQALVKLSRASRVQVMRTFYPWNGGEHGKRVGAKWICSCADIMVYRGFRFHYTVPRELLIEGVVQLIQDLPETQKYDLGFVRPIGGDLRFDQSMDVFFPVTTPEQAHTAFLGVQRQLSEMLEPARTRVTAALASKRYGYLYADAADHVHIRAYS